VGGRANFSNGGMEQTIATDTQRDGTNSTAESWDKLVKIKIVNPGEERVSAPYMESITPWNNR
jgi:hypothetical protein